MKITDHQIGWFPQWKYVVILFVFALSSSFLSACNSVPSEEVDEPNAGMTATPQSALPTAPSFVSTIAGMPQGSLLATVTPSVDLPPENEIEPCTNTAVFLADVTIPDDSVLPPGQPFEKIWTVRNAGTCFWEEGTKLVFVGGDQMAGPDSTVVPPTAPGQTVNVSVNLMAPKEGGTYSGLWQLEMTNGERLDVLLIVRIQVPIIEEATATPQPLPIETAVPTQQPIATPPPTPVVITGWQGQYFNNPNVEGTPALVRDDPQINFNWGVGSPAPQIQPDLFSARWTREVQFQEHAYTFFARSDDGVHIWVDNQLIIDQWHTATGQTYKATIFLTEGAHNIRVEYYEDVGVADVQVSWELTNQVNDLGWLGEYFATPALSGPPAHVRVDPRIDFNWGNGAPAPGVTSDNFSIRWRGNFSFEEGLYEFTIDATDGVRVYINDQLVLDDMAQAERRTLKFTHTFNNDDYDLKVEYVSLLGDAVIKISWVKKAL
mgnify:CR=1 FL=1